MNTLTCNGYTLFRGNLSTQQFTDLAAQFSKQTLAIAKPNQSNTIQVISTGLDSEQTLPDTVLEQLVWLLLNAPDSDIIMQPLYRCMHSQKAVTVSAYHPIELNGLIENGVIAVLRKAIDNENETVSAKSSAVEQLCLAVTQRQNVQVVSKPLLELTHPATTTHPQTHSFQHYRRTLVYIRRKGVSWLKQQLTIEQKTWLKQRGLSLLSRLGKMQNTPLDHADSLARLKSWPPFTLHSQLALHTHTDGQQHDTRIPVLIAVHWLELGGAEKFALDLIRALPKDQYKIYVTTEVTSKNTWAPIILDEIEALFHLPDFLQADMLGYFYEYLIRSRGIQILHIHHAACAYQALHHIRRFHPQLKVLDTLHIIELPPNSGGYPEYSAGNFDVFIDFHHVINQQLEQFLIQRWLIDSNKIRVIYLNVDTDHFDPDKVDAGTIRTQHNIPETASLIGFIGRLEPQKQPLAFVQMAHLLVERWKQSQPSTELHFIMVGSGLLEQEVIHTIKQLNLDNVVHLQGEVMDTRSIYKDCDLLAMPSENEGLALVTYEAHAMQTPIIFTDVGAQSELLTPEFLVPYDANIAKNMAQAIWPLMLNSDKRMKAGRAARQYILEHHCAQNTFADLQALYQELLT